MKLIEVESSMIAAAGYDESSQVLEMRFQSDKTWRYHGVPQDIYEGLMADESKGSYMRTFIIDCYPDE